MYRDPLANFRRMAAALTDQAVHAVYGFETSTEGHMERPPEGRGDLALPCFPLAAEARAAPHEIATAVVGSMASEPDLHVGAEGPYINFTITHEALVRAVLDAVHGLGAEYGTAEPTDRTVLVEHTSANPTGPLHVGRARNPILGDTLARVLRAAGEDVVNEYYVNDMGRQAAMLVWGVQQFGRGDHDKPDHALVEAYQQAATRIEEHPDDEAGVRDLISAVEGGDEDTVARFRETVHDALEGIRATLERLDIHHDNYKFESELVLGGQVSDVLERLRKLDALGTEDGAEYLDMTALGSAFDKDKFFITRGDGTTLYGTRDIAYHADKLQRADHLVDVLGEDHKLAFDHVTVALRALGETRPIDAVFYNFVSLPEGKMSTRSGRVVYLDDLLDEAEARAYDEVQTRRGDELDEDEMRDIARVVGRGAVRFNIVNVQAEKPITFKWEDALAFDGSSAPFVQYSHARTCGILDKAAAQGLEPWQGDLSHLEHESELALVRMLGRLPGLVAECADELKVHPLTSYAVDLGTQLNIFYRDCPVIQSEGALRDDRLSLVDAARQVLANVLDLLGIEAPRSM